MEESVFYIAEGDPADKHSQESFAVATSIHSSQQFASFRQANCPQNGAVLSGVGSGERLFVACQNKALLNVYSWDKESPDQRISVPEQLTALALCHHPHLSKQSHQNQYNLPNFRIPWLLAAGSKTGKIYIWELSSGNLICVKEAHYQAISALRFSKCGTFLISGGLDARCSVWRTIDLISLYSKNDDSQNIKPHTSFTDHSLPITDLLISETGLVNDLRLYTVSRDSTLRVYDVMTKSLLTTFVLASPIECVTKDPANRSLYVGLSNGLIRIIPLYYINPSTSVLESIGGNGKIITLDNDPNLQSTFVHHQQSSNSNDQTSSLHKSLKKNNDEKPIYVTKLSISLDGTNLISGDSAGRVFVADVITRQVLKTFIPCNSPISCIEVYPCPIDVVSNNFKKSDKKHRLIPQFKRVLASEEMAEHQLHMELPNEIKCEEGFDAWLLRKSQEEFEFKNLSSVNSTVKITSSPTITASDAKIKELEEKLEKVSSAYTNLRGKHEELYEEHKKLLSDS